MFTPIIGTESELGSAGLPQHEVMAAHIMKALYRRPMSLGVINGLSTSRLVVGPPAGPLNIRGSNGCRLYTDVHGGFEYAGPECRNALEGVTYELAGPHLINQLFCHVKYDGDPAPAWIIKNNNSPGPGFSYGNHINVQMPKQGATYDVSLRNFAAAAGTLVAMLALVSGAGLVVESSADNYLGDADYGYHISARSHYTGVLVSSGSTSKFEKPVFLQRPEPWATPELYWRLQILSLDANILVRPNLLKLTVVQLAAEMWCAGKFNPLVVADPVTALKELSLDWRATHRLDGKLKRTTAVQVLKSFHYEAMDYVRCHNRAMYLPGLKELAFQLSVFESTRDAAPAKLVGHNDWVTKYLCLKRDTQNFDHAELMHLKYHSFRLGGQFEASWPVKLIKRYAPPGFEAGLGQAVSSPPPTRALARSRFQAAVPPGTPRSAYVIDWNVVKYQQTKVMLGDPRVPTTPALEHLLHEMRADEAAA